MQTYFTGERIIDYNQNGAPISEWIIHIIIMPLNGDPIFHITQGDKIIDDPFTFSW